MKKNKIYVDILMFIIMLLVFNLDFTGVFIHELLGISL